jgi:DNA repair protein RecO (recombination protein O)
VLDREAGGGAAIRGDALYRYLPDRGPLPVMADDAGSGVELHGQTLIDMASDSYADPRTLQQSKLLMRALINHCLGDQILHTRQLLRDLQQL